MVFTSQLVQDFFHQHYDQICKDNNPIIWADYNDQPSQKLNFKIVDLFKKKTDSKRGRLFVHGNPGEINPCLL